MGLCFLPIVWPEAKLLTLHWRLLDTHKEVWLILLWGHFSFLLVSCAHKVLFVPSKNLFPQPCGSSVIKSHSPLKSNSLGVLRLFARSSGWEICCGSLNFLNSARISLDNCPTVCGYLISGFMMGLMATSSNRAYATSCVMQVCCSQGLCPHSRPLLTHASAGDTQTLKGRSGSV